MKSFIVIASLLLLSTVHAAPKSRVDNFEDEIMHLFTQFQSFFDRQNFELRTIRLEHVELITSIYDSIMESFGMELDIIRRASIELDEFIEQRIAELGNSNECLRNVISERDQISITVTRDTQSCAIRANRTMQAQLRDVFYPTFDEVQGTALTVELAVMDALSRGNVMDDETEIIAYLQSQFNFFSNLWPQSINQLLQWDRTRMRVEGSFLADEMLDCMRPPTTRFIIRAAALEHEAEMC